MHPCVLNHYYFETVPSFWERGGWESQGVSLDRFYRMLSHRWVGFLTAGDDGLGWKPGPSNRRRSADGVIEGAVDYVIIHPSSGILYLTPHAIFVIFDNLLIWDSMIF